MGMYDSITIEYPLPIPSYIPKKYSSIIAQAISTDEFQTKSLDRTLDHYFISNDGHLYLLSNVEFESNEEQTKTKIYQHGHIRVYSGIFLDDYLDTEYPTTKVHTFDIWLEYDLKFTDSLLVSATMISPTEEQINELH
ncbi:MAG: hypothetical protein RLZZ196_2765 [Bacteroidota bacterium]|jgi:hypothetical protein